MFDLLNHLMLNLLNISIYNMFIIVIVITILYILYKLLKLTDMKVDMTKTKFNINGIKTRNYADAGLPHYLNSWMPILQSTDLKCNDVKPIIAFGYELVAFRGRSGVVYVLDGICPHLGANLGVGGEVVNECGNECIKCPFHSWTFRGSDGKLNNKSTQLNCNGKPTHASVKVWESIEVNGFIFIWHHVDGLPPQWYPQNIEEIKNSTFVYRGRTEHTIFCHIQAIPENLADLSHFNEIHRAAPFLGTFLNKIPFYDTLAKHMYIEWDVDWNSCEAPEEHKAVLDMEARYIIFGFTIAEYKVRLEQLGPYFSQTMFTLKNFGGIKGYLLSGVTSLEPNEQKMVVHIYLEPTILSRIIAKFGLNTEARNVERDIIILNNKKFLNNPILAKKDKRIVKYRKWFKQFYSENSSIMDW